MLTRLLSILVDCNPPLPLVFYQSHGELCTEWTKFIFMASRQLIIKYVALSADSF